MALFQYNTQLTQSLAKQDGAKLATLFTKTGFRQQKKSQNTFLLENSIEKVCHSSL
jgi:hypothetical protein